MALARGINTCTVRSRTILHHLQPRRAAGSAAVGKRPTPLPDPHNVSHTLDAETSARIVDRLESRGQDEIFRSLFLEYFPELSSCRNVLEIGCGTVHMHIINCICYDCGSASPAAVYSKVSAGGGRSERPFYADCTLGCCASGAHARPGVHGRCNRCRSKPSICRCRATPGGGRELSGR